MGNLNSRVEKTSILVQSILSKRFKCKIPLGIRCCSDSKNFYVDTNSNQKKNNEYFYFIEIESGAEFEITYIEKRWGVDSGVNLYIYAKVLNNPKNSLDPELSLKNKSIIISAQGEMHKFFNYIDKNGHCQKLPQFFTSVRINSDLTFGELLDSKIIENPDVFEKI